MSAGGAPGVSPPLGSGERSSRLWSSNERELEVDRRLPVSSATRIFDINGTQHGFSRDRATFTSFSGCKKKFRQVCGWDAIWEATTLRDPSQIIRVSQHDCWRGACVCGWAPGYLPDFFVQL